MAHRWIRKVGVVSSTLGLGLSMLAGPAFAASNPAASSSSSTATTQMVMASSGISPLTTSYGSCGSASLTMFANGPGNLEAHYDLTSTKGNIVWENVKVTLNNGKSDNYDGAGPIFSAKASGQFPFSGLKSKTNYEGTLTGSVTLDSGNTCTIIPTSTTARTS